MVMISRMMRGTENAADAGRNRKEQMILLGRNREQQMVQLMLGDWSRDFGDAVISVMIVCLVHVVSVHD